MNRPPAFQFYPKDWMDFKVQRMGLEAQGAYMKLLCFMWNDSKDQCSILDNDILISRSLGVAQEKWMQIKSEIQNENDPIFIEKSGVLMSRRLRKEVVTQRKYRKSQSEKGKKSAEKRLNRGSTVVQPEYQPEGNSSSSSLSSSSNQKKKKERKNTHTLPAPDKFRHGEFRNVYLTADQYVDLEKRLGHDERERWITELDMAKGAKGTKTKDDYLTILNWERRQEKSINSEDQATKKWEEEFLKKP